MFFISEIFNIPHSGQENFKKCTDFDLNSPPISLNLWDLTLIHIDNILKINKI